METEEADNSNPKVGPSIINRASPSHQPTPTCQEIEQAQLQLEEFESETEAQLDESDLTESKKLEFRRHVEEMEEMLQDPEKQFGQEGAGLR